MKDKVGGCLLRWRIGAVLPHVKGRLLDVGCGTNDLVNSYDGDGIGVDVYQFGGADLIVEDTSKLPYDDGSFDTVSIVAALNHIPNRSSVLKEAYRVLRPDGKIVITMIPPRISRVWHFLRSPWDVDQSERGMAEGEVYGITRTDVIDLLNRAGFKVVFQRSFMVGVNCVFVAQKT